MSTDIRKVPETLSHGDRIIFSQKMGGSGEVVTVKAVTFDDQGIAFIQTEEKNFPILALLEAELELSV